MEAAQRPVEPAAAATTLAEQLLGAEDVSVTVLEETIDSAHAGQITESGRTACGSPRDVRPPVDRFPTSVSLAECPVGMVGIWHTHPTTRGLKNPEHSLPDWANVIFGHADASVVVGAETSEVVVAPANREAAIFEFQNAIGAAVQDTADVVAAVRGGQIPSPTAARRRVRRQLAPLVSRHDTAYPSLLSSIEALSIPAQAPAEAAAAGEAVACGCYATGHDHGHDPAPPRPRATALQERAKSCTPIGGYQPAGVDIRGIAIGTVVGNIVGTLTDRILFGG